MDAARPAQNRARPPAGARRELVSRHRRVSLCETLDRVLNKGAVVAGDVVISVAGVPLLYLGLNLVVTSVETMRRWGEEPAPAQAPGLPGPRQAPLTRGAEI